MTVRSAVIFFLLGLAKGPSGEESELPENSEFVIRNGITYPVRIKILI